MCAIFNYLRRNAKRGATSNTWNKVMVVYQYLSYICKNHLWTPKAKAEDLPFCLNIYLFSYLVFARIVNSRLPRRMRRFIQMFAARRCSKHRFSAKYEYKTQTIQRFDSLSRFYRFLIFNMGGSRGGTGIRTPPPVKSQAILVSIGNEQLDPPPCK